MFTLTTKPKILDNYSVVSFDLDCAVGEVGAITIYLHSGASPTESDLKLFKGVQGALGEDVVCEYGEWTFNGVIHELGWEASNNTLRITVFDALAKLVAGYRSQIFSETKLGDVVSEIIPSGQAVEFSSGFDKNEIKLEIQYQETDLSFLRRIVNRFGGQIWCASDTIHIGTPSTSNTKTLILDADVFNYSMQTGLGPEKVQLEPIPYKKESSSKETVELEDSNYGDLQKSVKGMRKKHQKDVLFHVILEDSTYNDPESFGKRFLRSQAGQRFVVVGTLNVPVPLGSCIKITDFEKQEETIVIRALRAYSGGDARNHITFEAVSPDGVILDEGSPRMGLRASAAIVTDADDPLQLNRVRVRFPWCQAQTDSPWLRVASPSWGENHMLYVPPKIDDAVMVLWGQDDFDPVVLGSLSKGDTISESSETLVLKTVDGQTITIGQDKIAIVNEASGGGGSTIEMKPDRIAISSDNIELSSTNSIKIDTSQVELDSDQMKLKSKQGALESETLELKSKQGTFEAQLLALKTSKLDVGP